MHEDQGLKEEIWKHEELFWEHLTTKDIDSFMSLWHDDFIGWPNNQRSLTNKDEMEHLVAAGFAATKPKSATYELTPLAVRIINNIGIVYYEAHVVIATQDGDEIATHERYSHTCLHTAGGWKIIAGMSASLGN